MGTPWTQCSLKYKGTAASESGLLLSIDEFIEVNTVFGSLVCQFFEYRFGALHECSLHENAEEFSKQKG